MERAIRAGFDYHVAKPANVERILALVADGACAPAGGLVPEAIETGHHEVDAQHASILAEAARLRRAGGGDVWDAVRFLEQHTAFHFEYEERLMADVEYPDREHHERDHREFLDAFVRLRDRLLQEGSTTEHAGALATAVEAWVGEHVLDEDRRLAEFVRRR